MVYISYHEFMTTPLVTSPETDDYKTTLLSFPGKIKISQNLYMCIYLYKDLLDF